MKQYKIVLLALVLCLSITITACSVSQFDAVLNEIGPAITTILEIVAIIKGVPANTSLPAKVAADVTAIENLDNSLNSALASAQPGIEGDIHAGFSVLNADLNSVFTLAQVSDPSTQAKITALVSLAQTAVGIAEAAIPNPASKFTASAPQHMTASYMIKTWNRILVTKTGNPAVDTYTKKHKLHNHTWIVRTASFGVEQ